MSVSMSLEEVYALISYNAATLANVTARGTNPPPADQMAAHLSHLLDLVDQVSRVTTPQTAPPVEETPAS